MRHVDVIIVGQGLAGSLLYHALTRLGQRVVVVDAGLDQAASMAAAGAMNPCASPRYTAPTPLDTWLGAARSTWLGLSESMGLRLYRRQRLIRLFRQANEAERVEQRRADPAVAAVLSEPRPDSPTGLAAAPGHVEIDAGQVDLPAYIQQTRQDLHQRGNLLEATFDTADLKTVPDGMCWGSTRARAVVLCQGAAARRLPGLDALPWRISRGVALTLEGQDGWPSYAVNRGKSLIPLTDGRYWLGATYDRCLDDLEPSAANQRELLRALDRLLASPGEPEVVDQRAGIRAGSHTGFPFCARLPGDRALYLFSGLGSRGTLLGPHCANTLARHLSHGESLPDAWNPWIS